VQPALFEVFGLTIIEDMASGLPTLTPELSGPLEIIEKAENLEAPVSGKPSMKETERIQN